MSKLKDEACFTFKQLLALKYQYALLDSENKHNKQLLESANAHITKLMWIVSSANSKLAAIKKAKKSLQKQLEVVRQQLSDATSALSKKVAVGIGRGLGFNVVVWVFHCRPLSTSRLAVSLQFVRQRLLAYYK